MQDHFILLGLRYPEDDAITQLRNVGNYYQSVRATRGFAVAQLGEALRYKPEGLGVDSRWCHWNFPLKQSFRSHYGPGVDSASNRNEYEEYFLGGKGGRCVGLTALAPLRADCLEIWEPQPPGRMRACPGPYKDCFPCTVYKCIWLNQLSNTTNLWWIDVNYIVINYMFRRLWPSSG